MANQTKQYCQVDLSTEKRIQILVELLLGLDVPEGVGGE